MSTSFKIAWGKTSVVIKNDAFSLAPVPTMGEGKPNQGFSYATAFEMPGSALQIARGDVEPKGKVAAHEGAQQYILYVYRGQEANANRRQRGFDRRDPLQA